MRVPLAAPVSPPEARRARAGRWAIPPGRRVGLAACVLIVVQLVIRGWVAGRGYFYWDDLILVGRAGHYPLLSSGLLLHDHDGHLMPAAFAVAWLVTRTAPLVWTGPVVSLLILQLAASLAVWRMVRVLGTRTSALFGPWLLVPLAFYLFCPLTVPAFAWWAAGLNSLPLQIALAWVSTDAVLLVRTGRVRHAVSGVLVFVVALLFFEKSVLVPFVAFAVAALVGHVDGVERPIRSVARRGVRLWVGSGVVLAGWAAVYLGVAHATTARTDHGGLANLLHSATSLGIVPTLLGGPWVWARWLPATPWATPPAWAVVVAWIALGATVALSIRARRRVTAMWVAVAVYVLAAQVPIVVIRGGPNTAAELMQSLRYLADVAVVLTASAALVLRAQPRTVRGRAFSPLLARSGVPVLVVLFVASSLWSTVAFERSWSISPTRTYLTQVRAGLAADHTPLLDQEVPWDVLTPLAYPQNLAGRVLAPIAGPGGFATSTPRLRMITDSGNIVQAQVWWNRGIRPGPVPRCGYRVTDTTVEVALDGPMLDRGWTAQLNYFATRDGRITVGFENAAAVVVPVSAGLHTVFVRLTGGGDTLLIATHTPGLDLCLGAGPVGVATFDR